MNRKQLRVFCPECYTHNAVLISSPLTSTCEFCGSIFNSRDLVEDFDNVYKTKKETDV